MVLFGEVINMFLYNFITSSFNPAINESLASYVQSSAQSLNMSCSDLEQNYNLSYQILQSVSNSSIIICGLSNEGEYANIIGFSCDPNGKLTQEVKQYSIYFVILGVAALVAGFLGALFWNTSAYRQTRRIREALYHSILQQEIGWFDVNNALEVNTRLIE